MKRKRQHIWERKNNRKMEATGTGNVITKGKGRKDNRHSMCLENVIREKETTTHRKGH